MPTDFYWKTLVGSNVCRLDTYTRFQNILLPSPFHQSKKYFLSPILFFNEKNRFSIFGRFFLLYSLNEYEVLAPHFDSHHFLDFSINGSLCGIKSFFGQQCCRRGKIEAAQMAREA